jgi:hypothetical protein
VKRASRKKAALAWGGGESCLSGLAGLANLRDGND